MARIFITGSADGLGQMAAGLLVKEGHDVVLHARNAERGKEAMAKVPGAKDVLIGDLSDTEQTKRLAQSANESGRFDAVIHNAGVLKQKGDVIFRVNVLAPYLLTCLMEKPRRLVYLSSSMHRSGGTKMMQEHFENRSVGYSESKLYDLMLAKTVARLWTDVYSNAVDPGWVPTRMGGRNATDDLEKGKETQAWLAASDDAGTKVSGRYFRHQREDRYQTEADEVKLQDEFFALCERVTGIPFPVAG